VSVAKADKDQGHPILTTKRLRLRRFTARDLTGLHACFGDAVAMRYWNFPPSKTEAESARRLKYLAKSTSPYSFLAYGQDRLRASGLLWIIAGRTFKK